MNGQLKAKKYTGLALLVAGCTLEAYYHGLDRKEVIDSVPVYMTIFDSCLAVTGAYLVGHYNGYKSLGDKVRRRYEKGLRYDPPRED